MDTTKGYWSISILNIPKKNADRVNYEVWENTKDCCHGARLTGRAYPVVPKDECGIRFGMTSLHTAEQIEKTLNVIDELCTEFNLLGQASSRSRDKSA
ncbi:MAG: hypothetical protein IPM97_17640 [Bdellovibrionaceae bacterium]|nr:hypothetical protein [Pseudobdellovibrionaceae bacterium]